MRKIVLAATIAALVWNTQPVTAGLVGTPINLIAAIAKIDLGIPLATASSGSLCGSWTDDVWSGPVRVPQC